VLLGVSVSVNAAGTIVTLALACAAYLLLLVGLLRAAREHRDGTALALTAIALGVISLLLVPLTWGMSLFLAAVVVPLAVPGLVTPGRGRWLASFALVLNVALTVMLALAWFV
jgi:hypothetical protein